LLLTLMLKMNSMVEKWPLRYCIIVPFFVFFVLFVIWILVLQVFVVLFQSVHDGRDIYFLLQVDGDYVYSNG
jgi:ABC-type uncharacterized transport system permease subunit